MALLYPDIIQHSNSTKALIDSTYVRGGLRTVANQTDLATLATNNPDQLTANVTRVNVTSDSDPSKDGWWTWDGSTWTQDDALYELPSASTTARGGVIIGDGINVVTAGVTSTVGTISLKQATTTTLGGITAPVAGGLTLTSGALSINTSNGLSLDATSGYIGLGGSLVKNTDIIGSSYYTALQLTTGRLAIGVGVSSFGASTYPGMVSIINSGNQFSSLFTAQDVSLTSSSNAAIAQLNAINQSQTTSVIYNTKQIYSAQYNILNYATGLGITNTTNVTSIFATTLNSIKFSNPTSIYNTGGSYLSGVTSILELSGTISSGTTPANTKSWAASTSYNSDSGTTYADFVSNSGNIYKCTTSGTSASSGGPSVGSGTETDGPDTLVWTYVGTATNAPDYNYQLGDISLVTSGSLSALIASGTTPYIFNGVINKLYGLRINSISDQLTAISSKGIINNLYSLYIGGGGADNPNVLNRWGIYQNDIKETNVFNGIMNLPNLPTYTDNTAASSLPVGTLYRTSSGVVMVRY